MERVLESVGFGDEMRAASISSLSGGWKMKLALGECKVASVDVIGICLVRCSRDPDRNSSRADDVPRCCSGQVQVHFCVLASAPRLPDRCWQLPHNR